jgi:hypothetical protein
MQRATRTSLTCGSRVLPRSAFAGARREHPTCDGEGSRVGGAQSKRRPFFSTHRGCYRASPLPPGRGAGVRVCPLRARRSLTRSCAPTSPGWERCSEIRTRIFRARAHSLPLWGGPGWGCRRLTFIGYRSHPHLPLLPTASRVFPTCAEKSRSRASPRPVGEEGCQRFPDLVAPLLFVMAGLVPAIPVLGSAAPDRRGSPAQGRG